MRPKKVHNFVDDTESFSGKFFDYFIQVLIVFSLLIFALETLPDITHEQFQLLHRIELVLIGVFTVEFLLRLYFAEKPWKYIFSFYGMIDIISILPFYLHFGLGFSSLRALRVFRIFRALKIVRYNKAINRFGVALKIIKEEMILFSLLAAVMLYVVSAGIYYFEHEAQPELFKSIFHSLWWSMVTLSTVGYGDVYPITVGGRVFTFFVLIIGVALMTIPAGIFTTALMKAREMEEEEQEKQRRAKENATIEEG